MKTLHRLLFLMITVAAGMACSKSDAPSMTLRFNNTFKDAPIILAQSSAGNPTVHTSAAGQTHYFSELKYVISNIRLVKADGTEVGYQTDNLDKGATVVNQAKPQTLEYVLQAIPAGEYRQIKFGLGVQSTINTADEVKFPKFYAEAGANDTEMMWEWGAGYRFVKIEGFYDVDRKTLSVHTGSTVEGDKDDNTSYTQGVDAYRDITLPLPQPAVVGELAPRITIRADFDKLLSGNANTIVLGADNATPSVHTALNMVLFVDNLGGDGQNDKVGMFSIESVEH